MKNQKLFSEIWQAAGSDPLRPIYGQVHFRNGFAYCTNAHIAVRQSLQIWGCSEDEIELLEGKCILADDLKKASKELFIVWSRDNWKAGNQVFSYPEPESNPTNILDTIDDFLKIASDEIKPLPGFCFDPVLFAKFGKAMLNGPGFLVLFARHKNQPFIAIDSEELDISKNAGLFFPGHYSNHYDDPKNWGIYFDKEPEPEPEEGGVAL